MDYFKANAFQKELKVNHTPVATKMSYGGDCVNHGSVYSAVLANLVGQIKSVS